MSQPEWEYLANLGDVNPLDHGGYFVYRDKTGVYQEEAELIEVEGEENTYYDDEDEVDEVVLAEREEDCGMKWTIHRFVLERCTYINGVLSDNPSHPECSAWFAGTEQERKERPQDTTYLSNVASHCGIEEEELIRMFCSDNPMERAQAYRAVGEHHGFDNFDSDPLEFTSRKEMEERYAEELKVRR